MDVINKVCPICGNKKLKWRNPKGYFHAFQDCNKCGCSVGFKRFYNNQVRMIWEFQELKHKVINLKNEIEELETLMQGGE